MSIRKELLTSIENFAIYYESKDSDMQENWNRVESGICDLLDELCKSEDMKDLMLKHLVNRGV